MTTFPQMPLGGAFTKEVIELPSLANFPATGTSSKLYIAADTGSVYRWNGTAYAAVTSASSGVLQFANLAAFPATGASATLYIAADSGYVYRWNGTGYVQIGGSGSGVSDHGALTGLADDDHPQYHNDARGDARYSLLGHTHNYVSATYFANLNSASNGQVLKWSSALSAFVPAADATGGGGASVADADYGDVTVSGGGSIWTLDDGVVTLSKLGGTITTAGKALLDDADAAAQRTTLGLGTAATQASGAFESAGAVATHAGQSTAHGISSYGSTLVAAADAAAARTVLGVDSTFLLNRANHSGTQLASTISDFSEATDDRVAALLQAGANITLTYNDASNTLTIASSGGGGGATLADGDYGDVTVSGTGTVITIDNASVTLAKLASIATGSIMGRTTAGTGAPEALTASQARTVLGLVLGTDVQAYSANLAAFAGLTSAADKLAYFTGSGTAATTDLTAAGRAVIGAANAAAQRTALGLVIGTDVQAFDAELSAIAGLTSAADRLPYYTGSGTAALATFTAYARTLVDDADAATARTTLGLGTIATLAAPSGTVVGTTDAQTLTNKTLTSPVISSIVNTGTLTMPTSTDTLVGRSTTDTLANKTLSAPSLSGIWTTNGAQVTTANAMGALAIDVTKGLNTKSVAADSTFTFSATPSTDTWFGLWVKNTDTNPHTLTIPSSRSMTRGVTVTTVSIPASSEMFMTWRYDGTTYQLLTSDGYLNKWDATAAPAVTDDVSKGYGPGSMWGNATGNTLYWCESNSVGAAVWNQAGGGGTLTDGDKGDITVSASGATWTIDNTAVSYAKIQNISATARVLGRNTAGAGVTEEVTLSQLLDFVGSAAQGDILYRGASTWTRLGAGTSGQFLQTQGAGANPQWSSPAGSGDVSSNTATSVDSEIALFNSTTGKSIKRAAVTGMLKATSGVLAAATAGSDYYAPGGTDVAVADGGTGLSSGTSGGVLAYTATGTLASSAALTNNSPVLGGGAGAVPKVVAGIASDGTSQLQLGVAGTSVGSVQLRNATSGSITIQPPTGALGTVTLTAPAVTSTLAVLGLAQAYTAAQYVTPSALTDGANIAVNAALSNNFTVVLGGNRTLDNPTNPASGQVINIRIRQDATGTRTLAFGTAYWFPGGTDPTLSTAANAVDLMSCQYDATLSAWLCNMTKAYA